MHSDAMYTYPRQRVRVSDVARKYGRPAESARLFSRGTFTRARLSLHIKRANSARTLVVNHAT